MFLAIVSIIQLIIFLTHWFFYRTLVRLFAIQNPSALLALKILIVLLSISFITASVAAFRWNTPLIRFFYLVSAAWTGTFMYLFWAAVLTRLVYLGGRVFSSPISSALPGALILSLGLLVGIYGIVNARIIRVTRLDVGLPNLPQAWKGRTAVWASDLHLGVVLGSGFAEKITEMINGLKPDIIFLGGDVFDGVADHEKELIGSFSRLRAPMGAYFITGNHEEFRDKTVYINAVRNLGIKVLDNQAVDIDGLRIIGVDYHDTLKAGRYRAILSGLISADGPQMLLKHSPFYAPISNEMGIGLELCGHTHGGQIVPVNFVTHQVYSGLDSGLHRAGRMIIYTSSGAGTWGPPLRVGTTPEIVVIRFK